MKRALLIAALAAAPLAPATAHVTVEPAAAAPNATIRVTYRVPHGCGTAGTTRLRVVLPEGVTAARPMPKPGWTLTLVPRPDAPPPTGHGAAVELAEVIWEGGLLPNAHYDEFVLRFRTPNTPGESLWLPVIQGCEGGLETAWTQVPGPGQRITELPTPAAQLRLNPR
jgi:uncharacterized protein YcnI